MRSELPDTIREINDLPPHEKRAIYTGLLPGWVFELFGVDPQERDEHDAVRLRCPAGSNAVELSIYHASDMSDPALYLHMGDTFTSQLIVLLAVVNDPAAPRFNIDVDEHGRSTELGTRSRNIAEEIRAMQAGLAPGQIRRGMRIFRRAMPVFEEFVQRMKHDLFLIEPLFYHNAITFERYGFAYARGLRRMKAIHEAFQPGGKAHARLDGSTPFRAPDAWGSVLGRSWAIHDGVLGEPMPDIQMYKRVGKDAGVCTFPGATW